MQLWQVEHFFLHTGTTFSLPRDNNKNYDMFWELWKTSVHETKGPILYLVFSS